MFDKFKKWCENLSGTVKEWEKPYVHDVLELEVHTKEEHEAVTKILKMNTHAWRIALDKFKKDEKRSPELWSPRTFELIFKAFNTKAKLLGILICTPDGGYIEPIYSGFADEITHQKLGLL